MLKEPQITAAYFRGLVDYLANQGVNTTAFLHEFSLSEELISNFQFRLPLTIFAAMLNTAESLSGDADIGLHVGEHIKPSQYGVLGLSVMNCRNVEEAIKRHERYEYLVSNIGHCIYETDGDKVNLIWDTELEDAPRHIAEENVSSWITFARWISARDISPTAIYFQHDKPLDIREHERIFRCPIHFNARKVLVEFPVEFLALPLRQHDPGMLAMLDDYAERLLVKLNTADDVIHQIKAIISTQLQSGDITLGSVALELGTSERNLQRKLKEHDWSYQKLLDDTRKTMALKLLPEPQLDFSEITYLLGFSDQSSFQKSFKKWTGMTPGAYRSSLL